MDDIDRKLLRLIQTDAGMSQQAMSDAAGLSPASCWRRLKALEADGVLGALVRLINPDCVGLTLHVICHIRVSSHNADTRAAFEAFAVAHPEILQCFSMSGEWDYLLHIVTRDMASYEGLLMRELLTHPSVATSASHFALKCIKQSTALPL